MTKSKYGYKLEKEKTGQFKKGYSPYNKGIIQKNHWKWKGGVSREVARKICIKNGKDMAICQICGEKNRKIIVHHHNGNNQDNRIQNLGLVCSWCHYAIHGIGINTRFQDGHNGYRNSGEFQIGHRAWNKGLTGQYTFNKINDGIKWQKK